MKDQFAMNSAMLDLFARMVKQIEDTNKRSDLLKEMVLDLNSRLKVLEAKGKSEDV